MNDDLNAYFNTVYDATFRTLMRVCLCKARRLADADDLLQNTYASFYRHIRRHGPASVENAQAYLLTLLRRELAAYYRKWPWERETALDEIAELAATDEPPEAQSLERLTAEEIWTLLERESELTQRVFVLYYGYEMRIKEIASALKLSESAVKNRLLRTQKKLRSSLSKKEEAI